MLCEHANTIGLRGRSRGSKSRHTPERLSRDAAAAASALPCTRRGAYSSLSLSPVTYCCHTGAAACAPPSVRPPRSTLVSAAHVTTVARSWPSARAADCLHRWRRRRARGPTSGSRMPPSRPRRGFRRERAETTAAAHTLRGRSPKSPGPVDSHHGRCIREPPPRHYPRDLSKKILQ